MIKRLEVKDLHGRPGFDFEIDFHPDLNLFTGKNGSGKTTLLKVLWYLVSGNLERLIPEITFTKIHLTTNWYTISLDWESVGKTRVLTARLSTPDGKDREKVVFDQRRMPQVQQQMHVLNANIITAPMSSLFFPTFRRVEGGFSTQETQVGQRYGIRYSYSGAPSVQQALEDLADRLTVNQHKFIASISTRDIVDLLTTRLASVSRARDDLYIKLSTFIEETIGSRGSHGADAAQVLKQVEERLEEVNRDREALQQPFSVLESLTKKILAHKGIRIGEAMTFGETADAITSDKLSAGEKQMLSFLSYNAFASSCCFFIDEPEISLHVDWQRILFPTILQQRTGNQFFVATHSPFIYTKYKDKEKQLDKDRGDQCLEHP